MRAALALVVAASSNRRYRAAAIAIGIASAVASVFALARASRPPHVVSAPVADDEADGRVREELPTTATTTTAANGAPVMSGARIAPAMGDRAAEDPVAALRQGLGSDDEAMRIAAVEAAVRNTSVETLGVLTAFDLKRDPEVAPTVIHAVALLGASAEGKKRDAAAGTLARWLRDEMRREGPDVPGNVSNLVEALGDVGGRDAVDALVRALDGQELPLHVETLAVMKLGELGDASARGAVERFAARVARLPPADGIDEELRVEALAAAHATLARI